MQSFHTFIDTFYNTFGRIVPRIHPILSITSHLGGKIIAVTENILQSLSQNDFSFVMTIIRRDIYKIHP